MGKNQTKALRFYSRCDGWQSYHKSIKPVIMSLVKKGFLEDSGFNQARITEAGRKIVEIV